MSTVFDVPFAVNFNVLFALDPSRTRMFGDELSKYETLPTGEDQKLLLFAEMTFSVGRSATVMLVVFAIEVMRSTWYTLLVEFLTTR